MPVSLIIFCSHLSSACSTCNLSFQSLASSVAHFESSHDAKSHEDVLIGLARYSQLLRMRKNAAAPQDIICPYTAHFSHSYPPLDSFMKRQRVGTQCDLCAGGPVQVLLHLSNSCLFSGHVFSSLIPVLAGFLGTSKDC